MVSSVIQKYKNKYTRELARLLLVHLPPRNGKCFGLTGNFMPVVTIVKSKRKFGKLRGWFYTEYAVTNKYAKLSERMRIERVDENLLKRLYMRFKTTAVPTVNLCEDLFYEEYAFSVFYVTLLTKKNIMIFFINNDRHSKISSLAFRHSPVAAKKFTFHRYKTRIVNYVTDNPRILKFMNMQGFNKRS